MRLRVHGARFRTSLKEVQATRSDIPWYPYDTFANFFALDQLLRGDHRQLLRYVGQEPIVDIGCADGGTAFYLESLGYPVHAIDNPSTNHNNMRGIWALHEMLHSQVQIHVADLDSQFTLPLPRYSLAIFLGILYHLKNPYYALETLARHTRYCVLSTRIARVAPDGKTPLDPLPVAYLLDSRETNNDETNYWIFTEAGLRRILDRTHWDVLEFTTVGHTGNSDPTSQHADERAFCFLRSRLAQAHHQSLKLSEGWYELEEDNWRWTAQRFAVELDHAVGRALQFRFFLHEALLREHPVLTLSATFNGVRLPEQPFHTPGPQLYTQAIPEHGQLTGPVRIEFALSHAMPAAEDQRELGVQVTFDDFAGPIKVG